MSPEAWLTLYWFTAKQEFDRAKECMRINWSGAAHKHLCQSLYWHGRYLAAQPTAGADTEEGQR